MAPPKYGRAATASTTASASASNSSAASTASTTTHSRSPGLTPTGSSTSFGAADSSSKPSSSSYGADVTSLGSGSDTRLRSSKERERSTGLNEEHMSKLSRGEAPMMSQLLKEAPLIAKTQTQASTPNNTQQQPPFPIENEEGVEMPRTRHDLHVISGVPQRKFRDTFVKVEHSPTPGAADQSAAGDVSKNGGGPQVNDSRLRNKRQMRQSEHIFGRTGEPGDDANAGRESSNELSVSTNNLNGGQMRSSSNSPSKQSVASLNTSAYSSDASSSSFMTSPAAAPVALNANASANSQFFASTGTFSGQEVRQQPVPGAVVVRQGHRDRRERHIDQTQQMLALTQATGRVNGSAATATAPSALAQPAAPLRESSPQQAPSRVSSRRMEADPDDENFVRISPAHKPSPGPAANPPADTSESPYANTLVHSSTASISARYATSPSSASASQPVPQQSQNYLANFYQSVDSTSSKRTSWTKDASQTPPPQQPQQSAVGEQSSEKRLSRSSLNNSLTASTSGQPSAYSATSGKLESSPAPAAPASDAAADGTPEVSPSQKCAVCSDPLSCGAAMYALF